MHVTIGKKVYRMFLFMEDDRMETADTSKCLVILYVAYKKLFITKLL